MVDPLLVVANANAGSTDEQALQVAVEVLSQARSVEVARTADTGELNSVLHRAGSRTIVVAGGDGSLHAVIGILHRRNELRGRTLGLIPLGTGNDFARALEIPLDPEASARAILTGAPRPTDLLVDDSGEITVNGVHVGTGAEASRSGADWKRVVGRVGYPLAAIKHLVAPRSFHFCIEVDGEVVNDMDRPVLQVAIGIGRSVGGGAELTPDALVDDGLVDVMISRATGTLRSVGYAAAVLARRHPAHRDVDVLRGRTVKVSGEEFWCSSDGEISGPERSLSWRVEPSAYHLIREASAAETAGNPDTGDK